MITVSQAVIDKLERDGQRYVGGRDRLEIAESYLAKDGTVSQMAGQTNARVLSRYGVEFAQVAQPVDNGAFYEREKRAAARGEYYGPDARVTAATVQAQPAGTPVYVNPTAPASAQQKEATPEQEAAFLKLLLAGVIDGQRAEAAKNQAQTPFRPVVGTVAADSSAPTGGEEEPQSMGALLIAALVSYGVFLL